MLGEILAFLILCGIVAWLYRKASTACMGAAVLLLSIVGAERAVKLGDKLLPICDWVDKHIRPTELHFGNRKTKESV